MVAGDVNRVQFKGLAQRLTNQVNRRSRNLIQRHIHPGYFHSSHQLGQTTFLTGVEGVQTTDSQRTRIGCVQFLDVGAEQTVRRHKTQVAKRQTIQRVVVQHMPGQFSVLRQFTLFAEVVAQLVTTHVQAVQLKSHLVCYVTHTQRTVVDANALHNQFTQNSGLLVCVLQVLDNLFFFGLYFLIFFHFLGFLQRHIKDYFGMIQRNMVQTQFVSIEYAGEVATAENHLVNFDFYTSLVLGKNAVRQGAEHYIVQLG